MAQKHHFGKRMPKVKKVLTAVTWWIAVVAVVYIFFSYSNISFIRTLRHMAIETSLSTMQHQWVAYAIFPDGVVDEVHASVENARDEQIGVSTTWGDAAELEDVSAESRLEFFNLFHELDENSVTQYLAQSPELLQNGWGSLYINEAGLNKTGTEIVTKQGDSVLAIDAKNGVLLIRVADLGYQGVLAIAKDPTRLSVCPSSQIGHNGELVGEIAAKNNGILAMTGSGFRDVDEYGVEGQGNGGIVAGLVRCAGETYGEALGAGFKRVELRTDDRLYIVDSQSPIHSNCTDAVEFTPALIVDGEVIVDENSGWNSINPRACIGQNSRGEILMLCIEGRQLSSIGISVVSCAEILRRYDCEQAINLDGGTSAIMWYDGECVIRCCNEDFPEGRPLPNAFVYKSIS